jgi:hypothetical protein
MRSHEFIRHRFSKVPGYGIEGVRSGDARHSDRLGWPVDALSTPTVDWADGDGTSPAQGPTLTLAGTPDARVATPWTKWDGTPLTHTCFAATEHYRSATATNPSAGEDMVILVLARRDMAGTGYIFSTRVGGAGWALYSTATQYVFVSDDGVANVASGVTGTANTWVLLGVTYDASGDQYLYVDGALADNDTVSGLGALTGTGVGINSNVNGAVDLAGDLVRAVAWYGSNLAATADAAWHLALAQQVVPDLV